MITESSVKLEDIKGDGAIGGIGRGGEFKQGEARDAVNQGMGFVATVELILLLVVLVGSGVNAQAAIKIGLWLVILFELTNSERFGVVLRGVDVDGCGVKSDEGGIYNPFANKFQYLATHDTFEDSVVHLP